MKLTKLKNNYSYGFTLIELMVVAFVISLITTVSVASYRSGEDELKIKMDAYKLASTFRDIQGKALGAVEYNSNVPDGGWGVHIDIAEPTQYKTFANTNYNNGANLKYDIGEGDHSSGAETINLKEGVKITNISVGAVADITFVPPDPKIYIYNGTATSTNIEITLEYKGISKKVLVNYFGLIETID